MPPKISIIIPVLNEVDNIEQCVARALPIGDQIIIADGGSTDGTIELAENLACTLCQGSKGRGPQLAAGAKLATGDMLLFLHADNWLAPSAKMQLVESWQSLGDRGGTLYGCFMQRIASDRTIFRFIEKGNYWRARYQKLPYGDQGMFVSRTLYDQVGGIPKIPLMEDFEFSRLLSREPAAIKILPGPIHVDPRRWEKTGPLRQTIRNWSLAMRYRLGTKPEKLLQKY